MELRKAKAMAIQLMKTHNLIVGSANRNVDWKFKFDNAKRRFGVCRPRSKIIGLSRTLTLLNSEERVKNTILHEIAHALAPKGEGHGREWKQIAASIGCDAQRCYNPNQVVRAELRWVAVCPKCGYRHMRARAKVNGSSSCGQCNTTGSYDPTRKLEYKLNPRFTR